MSVLMYSIVNILQFSSNLINKSKAVLNLHFSKSSEQLEKSIKGRKYGNKFE
jgi:hypothetical protein